MKKNEYLVPEIRVVEIQARLQLLTGSKFYSPQEDDETNDGTEEYDYDDEMYDSWFYFSESLS